jgi:hypothetical protein
MRMVQKVFYHLQKHLKRNKYQCGTQSFVSEIFMIKFQLFETGDVHKF